MIFSLSLTHSEAPPPVSIGSPVISAGEWSWRAAGLRATGPGSRGGEPGTAPGAQPATQKPVCTPS